MSAAISAPRRLRLGMVGGGQGAFIGAVHRIAARLDAGGDIRLESKDTVVEGVESDRPRVRLTDKGGRAQVLECDFVAGCDGSYGASRPAIPQDARKDYLRIYPFGWFGILAPAGTPEPVIAKLNAAIREVLANPELQQKFVGYGGVATGSTPAELAAMINAEVPKWKSVVETAKITTQ